MAKNPLISQLSELTIAQRTFDSANDRVRVDANITAPDGSAIIIDAADDSIKIGDGLGSFATITNVGGKSALDVNIAGGSITLSSDVKIQDSSGNVLNSTSGALNVQLQNATVAVTGTFWQATQPISGSVSVSNFPATQPVSGTVAISNFPGTQPVSGTVTSNQGTGGASAWLVTGTGGTFPVTGTFWQATQPVSGTVTANAGTGTFAVSAVSLPLPSGASTSALQTTGNTTLSSVLSALGSPFQAGGSIGNTSFIATQASGANLHVNVDNFPGTQPVSGTVTVVQPTGSSLHTVVDSGTITANAGSGTFTVAGTVTANAGTGTFTVDASGHTVPVSGTFFQATQPVSGTVTANAGTGNFTVAQSSGANLHVNVDNFPATQPVSGTVAVTQSTSPWVVSGAVTANAGSGTFTVAGTVTANAGTGTFTVDASGHTVPISAVSLPLPTGASTSALQTTGNTSLSSIDSKTPALGQALAAASVPVVLTAAQLTTLTPLTSVTVTQASGANLHVNVDNFPADADSLAQSSTTSGQLGALSMGAVTTAAPAYTTAQTNPLSLTTAGALRVDGSGVTQPVSGTVTANQGGAPWLVNARVQDNIGNGIGSDTGNPGIQYLRTSVVQSIVPSTNNSSVANLASGASFTGVADISLGQTAIEINFFSDQPCTILVEQSSDATNWDTIDTYYTIANIGDARTFASLALYWRIIVTNTGMSASTEFRLQSALVPIASVLPRALSPYGNLQVVTSEMSPFGPNATQLFDDTYDLGLDTVNRWNTPVAAGGGVVASNTPGDMALGTGTTANGYSYITSQYVFQQRAPGWLFYFNAVNLESPIILNTYRFWGFGNPATTPTAAAPLTDAIGFEIATNGKMYAVCYSSGTRNVIQDMSGATGNETQPTDTVTHKYFLWFRGDISYWAIDSSSNIVAIMRNPAQGPTINALPLALIAVAGSTAPASSGVLQSNATFVGDTASGNMRISDGTFAWRKATVTNGGAVSVTPSDGYKATYCASITGLVTATNATDIFTITGSATKVVRVVRTRITGTQSTQGWQDVLLIKRSSANSAGTSTTQTAVPNDSADAAASAVVRAYTANPTLGAVVGTMKSQQLFVPIQAPGGAGAAGAVDYLEWTFGSGPYKALVLRGVAETAALSLNTTTLTGSDFNIEIEWTEE
jgi:hypothetical protein